MQLKIEMTHVLAQKLQSQFPTKESVAFTRYADRVKKPEYREKMQFPMGEPLKRIDPAKELFRVQKTNDHWSNISRSKQFLAEDFFPPRQIPLETNLQQILSANLSEQELATALEDVIPNLNHDTVVDLALYLAFEKRHNSKEAWRAIETATLESLHLMSIKQVCQMEWATNQMKPKITAGRFNTMLMQRAYEQIDRCSAVELCQILQGFRQKANKGLVEKIRKTLVERREQLFPNGAETEDGREMLINTMLTFASCRPKNYGTYKVYAKEGIEELVANYEHDLCEAGEGANPEQLTRLAQALYILQTTTFENIFWRVERRTH